MPKFILKDRQKFNKFCKMFPDFEQNFLESCKTYWNTNSKIPVKLSRSDSSWEILIPKEEIEQFKPLKPYIWYSVEQFDGNPNNFILIEDDEKSRSTIWAYKVYDGEISLAEDSTRFMYLER